MKFQMGKVMHLNLRGKELDDEIFYVADLVIREKASLDRLKEAIRYYTDWGVLGGGETKKVKSSGVETQNIANNTFDLALSYNSCISRLTSLSALQHNDGASKGRNDGIDQNMEYFVLDSTDSLLPRSKLLYVHSY